MAYRPRARRATYRTRRARSTRAAYAPRRRSTGRRRSVSSRAPQTVRIVLEQAAPSAIARPGFAQELIGKKAAPKPQKARL